MFRCEKCHGLSKRGEASVRVVVETRYKEYPKREQAMKRRRGRSWEWVEDPGGHGVEIAREEVRHEACV